jgi:hypothetical protein
LLPVDIGVDVLNEGITVAMDVKIVRRRQRNKIIASGFVMVGFETMVSMLLMRRIRYNDSYKQQL